ncbi:zinc finger, C3HC4 type, partial [Opisthorchis viverrini]
MGRAHSQLCHPVTAAINELTEELIRHYEMQSCIPIEFLEPNCLIYTAHGGLSARQRATIRALVNYAFLRAVHIRQTSSVLLLNGPPAISDLSSSITHGDTTGLVEHGNGTGTGYKVRNELTDSRGVQLSSFALISRVKKIQVDKLPTCPVCLVDYQENDLIITLPCFHVYHKACTGPWLKSDEGCAMCRLSPLDLIHNTKALLAQVAEEKRLA